MLLKNLVVFSVVVWLGAVILYPAISQIPLNPMPGDIYINEPWLHLYVPLFACVSASVVLTLLFWYLRK